MERESCLALRRPPTAVMCDLRGREEPSPDVRSQAATRGPPGWPVPRSRGEEQDRNNPKRVRLRRCVDPVRRAARSADSASPRKQPASVAGTGAVDGTDVSGTWSPAAPPHAEPRTRPGATRRFAGRSPLTGSGHHGPASSATPGWPARTFRPPRPQTFPSRT